MLNFKSIDMKISENKRSIILALAVVAIVYIVAVLTVG
jgi:hypothetical protein